VPATRVLIEAAPTRDADGTFELTGPAAHHLARVLRVRPGAAVILFDGSGSEWEAEVLAVDRNAVQLTLGERSEPARECLAPLVLLQGLCRGERMDWVMQKATELGAASILAVSCERSNVRLDEARGDKRLAHWRGVVASACEQSGRVRVPEVRGPLSLAEAIADLDGLRLLLDPEAPISLSAVIRAADDAAPAAILVGPEGGLSPAEIELLVAAGWGAVSMGPRILRTETAGAAALAAIQAVRAWI